jgi:hypothetical protein
MSTQTEINIEFTIYGDDFDPHAFAQAINLTPVRLALKGEQTPHKNATYKESFWEYASGYTKSLDFEEVFSKLKLGLEPHLDDIVSFVTSHPVQTKFDIVVKIDNGECPGLFFNKEFLNLVYRLQAEIDIDLYTNSYSEDKN